MCKQEILDYWRSILFFLPKIPKAFFSFFISAVGCSAGCSAGCSVSAVYYFWTSCCISLLYLAQETDLEYLWVALVAVSTSIHSNKANPSTDERISLTFVYARMSTESESKVTCTMEQSDFLEMATDSASLINIQSLNSIFVKAGYDRPDFVIKPTREKVIPISYSYTFAYIYVTSRRS